MPFAPVRDIEVYYEVHGPSSDPVAPNRAIVPAGSDAGAHTSRLVLIGGTGGDLRQNPRRDRDLLTRQHEVLMYDQRGLGRSGKPDTPYSMADYADDCVALMDHLGWERAHVVGISFGGMVAQHVAVRHPERVDRLVLACTSSGGAGGASFDLLAVDDLPPAERDAVALPVMDVRNDLSTDPPTLAPMFDLILAARGDGRPINADEPGAAMGARRQLEARAGHDVWDRLHEIASPTFVIGGRFDRQAPPENLERLASRIPDARLAFFDGGHVFLLQDRTAWPAVADFLAP